MMSSILLYIYFPFCLSIHLLMGLLPIVNNAIMDTHVQVSVLVLALNSLGIYLGKGLLGHLAILCLTLW